jgi:hypothetical protein
VGPPERLAARSSRELPLDASREPVERLLGRRLERPTRRTELLRHLGERPPLATARDLPLLRRLRPRRHAGSATASVIPSSAALHRRELRLARRVLGQLRVELRDVRGVDDQAPPDLGDPLLERADRRRLELVDER